MIWYILVRVWLGVRDFVNDSPVSHLQTDPSGTSLSFTCHMTATYPQCGDDWRFARESWLFCGNPNAFMMETALSFRLLLWNTRPYLNPSWLELIYSVSMYLNVRSRSMAALPAIVFITLCFAVVTVCLKTMLHSCLNFVFGFQSNELMLLDFQYCF